MSVLIKGMEMPKSCSECFVKVCAGRRTVKHFAVERSADCPLVHIPPHGRLIDADKQDVQIDALIERHLHGYTKSTWDFVCELRDILKRNYTILPAEEEKS